MLTILLLPIATLIEPSVRVTKCDAGYAVAATFEIAQPASMVRNVLTDYAGIPRFMPQVQKSTVLERDAAHVVVEQEAVAQLMMFSKRMHLVLEISETPDVIRFRDRAATSFGRYEGAWRLEAHDGGTTVRYE